MKKNTLLLFFFLAIVTSVFASPAEKQVILRLTDSLSEVSSQATVYFDINLHTNYVYPEDSQIIFDTSFSVPQIYSFTSDGIPCYTNGYGNFTSSVIVPLGIKVSGGSTYTFSQSQILNFDVATMIILEDRLTGTFTNLRQHTYSVSISQSGRVDGRFFLHLSYPPQVTDIAANCNNLNGTINVTEDSTITWAACFLYDSGSHLIGSYDNVTGNFNFTGLIAGAYILQFNYGTYAAQKPYYLAGGQISASIFASSIYAAVNEEIQFTSQAVNATQYSWNFGDGSFETGIANPSYTYLNAGVYSVSLVCSNQYNCVANGSLTMHIAFDSTLSVASVNDKNLVKISNDNKDVRITVSNAGQNDYKYEIHDISGQLLMAGPITTDDFIAATGNLSSGIYVVTVKSSAGSYTRKIFLP